MNKSALNKSEYNEQAAYYLELVPTGELISLLDSSLKETVAFFECISPNKHDHSYQKNKWSIKQVLRHMIDVERIFAFRILSISRGEQQSLPGFDVDQYGQEADADTIMLSELLEEFTIARKSTIALIKNLNPIKIQRKGIASGAEVSARALGFKLIGHDIHHCGVIKRLYL